MDGIDICPIHKCVLINSSVAVGVKASAGLVTAEQEVEDEQIVCSCNDREKELAVYLAEVFLADINYESDGIGNFLRSKLSSKYFSDTGVIIRIGEIFEAFEAYYGCTTDDAMKMRLQKIYNGYRYDSYEICKLALFQGISTKELINYKSSKHELLEKTYGELAEKYNLEYSLVTAIGEDIIKAYDKSFVRRKSGVQQKKWNELDEEYLDKVKSIIEQTLNNKEMRPVKICSYWMCKKLGISNKQMDKMPLCKSEIEKYAESQEHYWAREIIWAVNSLDGAGIDLCWRRVRELTNMRTINFEAALPYVKELTDTAQYDCIRQLL